MNYFWFLVFTKIIKFKFVHEVCIIQLKQTKTNLQKYLHPSSIKPPIYTRREPNSGQQKVPILKKTTVLWPSRSYYSMVLGMELSIHNPNGKPPAFKSKLLTKFS